MKEALSTDSSTNTSLLHRLLNASFNSVVIFQAQRHPESKRIVDFTIATLNELALADYSKPKDSLIGQSILTLFGNEQGRQLIDQFAQVVVEESSRRFTLSSTSSATTEGPSFDVLAAKLDDDRVVMNCVDLTATNELREETQLNRQRADAISYDLQRSNENLRQFAQVASNDLLNPLRKILSFSELLQSRYTTQLGTEGTDIVERIHTAAERINLFLRDLLSYSQAGSTQRLAETFWLTTLLNELTSEDLWPLIYQTKAEVVMSGLPMLTADRQQIRQLFLNLLSNALLFRRPEVTPLIQISCRTISGAELPDAVGSTTIQIQPLLTASYYEIAVEDNGIGFDHANDEDIFQAFRKLKPKDNEHGGSGIGLAICRRIVENHRGFITATGIPNQGATFRVYLPADL